MKKVSSTNISHVGYNKPGRTLTVRFQNGSAYSYPDVDEEHYLALTGKEIESRGSYFHEHIRGRKFTKLADRHGKMAAEA